MAIYKNKDIVTNIDATSVNIGDIGARFYTNDENSTSIRIYVKHNGVPINFKKTEFKPILKLSMEDGSYFDNEQLDIVLAEKGVIQYKISEKVIKHTGKVKAVLVLKNDTQTVHASDFLFSILDSGFNDKVAKEINVDLIGDKIEEVLTKNASKFKGEKGDKLTFDDLTDEDKEELKGEQGPKGNTGEKGPKGESLGFDDVNELNKQIFLNNKTVPEFDSENNLVEVVTPSSIQIVDYYAIVNTADVTDLTNKSTNFNEFQHFLVSNNWTDSSVTVSPAKLKDFLDTQGATCALFHIYNGKPIYEKSYIGEIMQNNFGDKIKEIFNITP